MGGGVIMAPPARDRRSAPASPDGVCACLSRSFFAMIKELLLLLPHELTLTIYLRKTVTVLRCVKYACVWREAEKTKKPCRAGDAGFG